MDDFVLHFGLPAVIALIVSTPSFVGEVKKLWALRESDEWPIAQATVQSVDVREVRGNYSHYFRADLGCFYVVNGSFYSGYVERRFDKEPEARECCRKAMGKKYPVRYDPVRFDPSKAVDERVWGS